MQRSLFLVLILLRTLSQAQVSSSIYFDGDKYKSLSLPDSISLINQVNELLVESIEKGFYFSALDSIVGTGDSVMVFIHKGKRSNLVISGKKKKNLIGYIRQKVDYFSNNGYPFVSVRLDSIGSSQKNIYSDLAISKGPLIENDSAFFYNDIRTSHSYLYHLIDHLPGQKFNQSDYTKISKKITRSSFLKLKRPVDISFQNGGAKLYLDLAEDKANSFNGVLGLQQDRDRTGIVGNFDLDIQNLFLSGKKLRLEWERFAVSSQELTVFYKHPFFLESKISPFFQFDLLRQDSAFITRSTQVGLSTFVSPKTELSINFEGINGTLLATEEELVAKSNFADYQTDIYRIQLTSGDFNELSSFKEALFWQFSLSTGQKSIQRNLNIADSFYDTLQLNTDILKIDLKLEGQLRLGNRFSYYQSVSAGFIDNDQLLDNERYRIGGLNSFRGFNEKFFFIESFILTRTEFRSFFESGSYLYTFYDQLFNLDNRDVLTPYGLGVGFSLATLSGQFSFALAVGKPDNQSFDLVNMKAHFGYLARF